MRWVKVASVVLIVASALVVMQSLPIARIIDALETVLAGLGVWAPVAFAAIYVIATVLMLPGSVFTIAAGAVFGFAPGFACVSIGATVGAACAFLIARFVARERVAGVVSRSPKLEAVDRAIGERGWRIVALLRLAPVIPFNLQNYLYGLTSIRFWPCILTSWVAMSPGIAMYVYIGHLARQGAAAAAGVEQSTVGVMTWVLRIVGLLATVAATAYLARVATRAVARQTAPAGPPATTPEPAAQGRGLTAGRTIPLALFAVAAVFLATVVRLNREALGRAVGRYLPPPRVVLTEAYTLHPGGPIFDHAAFDRLLREHVDEDGLVDYDGLRFEASSLDGYIESVAAASFDALGRDEKLAFLINAYNAFTLRLVLDHAGITSIREIASADRWEAARWSIGGTTWSLDQIEHELIRPNFREPRIHFALVCAAVGCPPLRREAYVGTRLETQLADQADRVHAGRWFRHDGRVARLTPLYNWYRGDFEQVAGSVLDYAAAHDEGLQAALDAGTPPAIEWLDYDWTLNAQRR